MSQYRDFKKQLQLEHVKWEAYIKKKSSPPLDSPKDFLNSRNLVLHYTAFESIIYMLEARDPYTADHSKRVSQMSLRIGFALQLSRAQASTVMITAVVHDIGKVGIPDSVLLKEGPLDPSELEIIKRHPSIGSDILLKSDGLADIATGVRHHHERWDGRGYPDGIGGADIPLSARIIAVCDSIDAMLSDRPYRKGMAGEDCRRQIEKNAAVMYDPELALLCLHHWEYITTGLYSWI